MANARDSNIVSTPVNGVEGAKTKTTTRTATVTFSEATGSFPLVISADIDWNDLRATRLDPFLSRLREHAVLGAAKGLSAIISETSRSKGRCRMCDFGADVAVTSAKVFLGLDLEAFCRDVVIAMVENNDFQGVARVQHKALDSGAEQLVQQLSVSLLCSGHTKHASLVTNAFVDECDRVGMAHREIAAALSNAVIAAVDCHHGCAVARVQKTMVEHGHFDVVKELTIYIGEIAGRPDVVAIGTLDAMKIDGGQEMAASVAAAAMAQGSIDSVAQAASIMYARTHLDTKDVDNHTPREWDEQGKVCETVALAALQGIEVHNQPLAVVQVSQRMWALGHGHAVTRAVKYMVDTGHSYPAGIISLTAMTHGYIRVSSWLLFDMFRSGYVIAVVIVALQAFYHAIYMWMNPWTRIQNGIVRRHSIKSHPITQDSKND